MHHSFKSYLLSSLLPLLSRALRMRCAWTRCAWTRTRNQGCILFIEIISHPTFSQLEKKEKSLFPCFTQQNRYFSLIVNSGSAPPTIRQSVKIRCWDGTNANVIVKTKNSRDTLTLRSAVTPLWPQCTANQKGYSNSYYEHIKDLILCILY